MIHEQRLLSLKTTSWDRGARRASLRKNSSMPALNCALEHVVRRLDVKWDRLQIAYDDEHMARGGLRDGGETGWPGRDL